MTTDFIDAGGWTLVHFIWQGLVIATLLFIALTITQIPRIRYRLAIGSLFLAAAIPVGTLTYLLLPRSNISAVITPATEIKSTPSIAIAVAPRPSPPASTNRSTDPMIGIVAVWAVGAALLSVFHFSGWLRVRRLVRNGKTLVDDRWSKPLASLSERLAISRTVRLLETAAVSSPAVVGYLRPVILLPIALAAGLTPSQIEMILAHELAHVRRNDYLLNLLLAAIEAMLFYHPAVWWISSQVRQERETCCDEIAIAACGGTPVEYARTLLSLDHFRLIPRPAVNAAASPLRRRIHRLLGLPRRWQSGSAAIAIMVLVATTLISVIANESHAAPATQAATFPITVLTSDGKPAAGAMVALAINSSNTSSIEAVADQNGVARLPGNNDDKKFDLLPFVGYCPGSGVTIAPLDSKQSPPTFRLLPTTSITLTFIDSDHHPVTGLPISAQQVVLMRKPDGPIFFLLSKLPGEIKGGK